jgi:hypothetical protein
MSEFSDLVKAVTGHEPAAPEWRTTSNPPIEASRFGRDHWSTFAYIETRIVDHKGALSHAHMRCHADRHPVMMLAKGSGLGVADGSAYPTQLRGGEEARDHDDYDCVDDLIAAGLLEVHMPEIAKGYHVESYYINAYGRPITDADGVLITADFVTGLTELHLCAHATFSLTERGKQVASDLRAHKANGNFATFVLE